MNLDVDVERRKRLKAKSQEMRKRMKAKGQKPQPPHIVEQTFRELQPQR
jgi:hypothetical protein